MKKKNKKGCGCMHSESYTSKDIVRLVRESKEKPMDFSKFSFDAIDKYHKSLQPHEQARFSNLIDDTSSVPLIIQQRNALAKIHSERSKPK
jgi:hypothetical protein